MPTCALLRLAFALTPRQKRLVSRDHKQLAGSFFNRHAIRPCFRAPRSETEVPAPIAPAICPLTACQQMVSGSLSLPSPGFFSPFPHGTLRYRSLWFFSLGVWSPLLPTRFLVSGGTHAPFPRWSAVAYRALTVSGGPSQGPSPSGPFSALGAARIDAAERSFNPHAP